MEKRLGKVNKTVTKAFETREAPKTAPRNWKFLRLLAMQTKEGKPASELNTLGENCKAGR